MIPIIHFWHNNTTKITRDITRAVHLLLLLKFTRVSTLEAGNGIHTRMTHKSNHGLFIIYSQILSIKNYREKICQLMHIFSKIIICTLCNGTPKASPASMWDVAGCVWQVGLYWQVNLPLCSPKNTSLNFLNGFPNSPEELILKCCII